MRNNSLLIVVALVLLGIFFLAVRSVMHDRDPFPSQGGQVYVPTSNVRYSTPAPRNAGAPIVGPSLPRGDRFASVSTASGTTYYRGGTVASVSTASGSSRHTASPILSTTSSQTIHSYGGSAAGSSYASSTGSRTSRNTSTSAGGINSIPSFGYSTGLYARNSRTETDDYQGVYSTNASTRLATPSRSSETFSGSSLISPLHSTFDESYSLYNRSVRRRGYADPGAEGSSHEVGDTKVEDGYIWVWNGTAWVKGPAQPGSDPDDPDPGLPGMQDMWKQAFIGEIGRDPYNDDELQEYINWKLGLGLYTPWDAPLGDGLWFLLLLALLAAVVKGYGSYNRQSHTRLRP